MSTQNGSNKPKTWEEEVDSHRPTPGGNLLFSLLLVVLATFYYLLTLPSSRSVGLGLGVTAIVAAFCLAVISTWGWNVFIWRNIIGYEVVHMRTDAIGVDVREQEKLRFIQKRSLRMPGKYVGHSVLIMPLGGWFARPHMRNSKTGRVNRKWRLKKWECHEMDDGTSTVQVRDRRGNKAVMSVQRAVEKFPEEDAHDLGRMLNRYFREADIFANHLREKIDYSESLIEARRKDRERFDLLVGNLDDLCADLSTVLHEMVDRLETTDRIKNARGPVNSKEAKPLLKYLKDELNRLQENGMNIGNAGYKRDSGNEPGARVVVHNMPSQFAG